MNSAVKINAASIRPAGQNFGIDQNDRQPGNETNAEDTILSRLDSMINALRKIRFTRALEHAEEGMGSANLALKRLNPAIDILCKRVENEL